MYGSIRRHQQYLRFILFVLHVQFRKKKTSLKIFIIRLQIKASEIVLSNSYKAGITLRFPRVQRIREDRAWDSCMTLSEVIEMRKYASGKLATRHCSFTGITLERLF
jgi:hypothetical protein